MLDIGERLENIEARLLDIEIRLGMARDVSPPAPVHAPADLCRAPPKSELGATAAGTTGSAATEPTGARTPASETRVLPAPSTGEPVSATQLMAWAAGLALLLAAIYFLRLVYDVGWLTPERQLALASLAGLGLMAGGMMFAKIDRPYAAYLPALGLTILYLSAYTAHLYYRLWSAQATIAVVCVITLVGVWLGRRFSHSVYVVIAAVGVYLSPLLMPTTHKVLFDVITFYCTWSLLFSFFALTEGRRLTYMLPMIFALIGFDAVWRDSGATAWSMAVTYQLIQLVIFASTAAAFSVLHKKPLNGIEGLIHALALLYFYGIEYLVLRQHLPQWAPRLALLSAAFLLLVYVLAKKAMQDTRLGVGAVIISIYCSVACAHAVFFEMMPDGWFAWAVLAATSAVAILVSFRKPQASAALQPVVFTAGLLFVLGYVQIMIRPYANLHVLMPNAALASYALLLYAGYFWFSRSMDAMQAAPIMLYAAHVALMAFWYRLAGDALALSTLWAVMAVVILIAAIASKDKVLGKSSLLIFCASGLKVLLHDLAGSGSMVRVVTLIVLAISLYVGGWLYQSLVRRTELIGRAQATER